MNIILNCPVCGYQEVASHTCPNCDTDLSVIRMLLELPYVETTIAAVKFKTLYLAIALVMLLLSICVGIGSWPIFQPSHLDTLTVSSLHPVAASNPIPKLSIHHTPVVVKQPPQPTTYTVKSGDYLSAIALKLCGQGSSWEIVVKANPQLQGRENYLHVGEVLKIPNCKERAS